MYETKSYQLTDEQRDLLVSLVSETKQTINHVLFDEQYALDKEQTNEYHTMSKKLFWLLAALKEPK